MEIIKKYKWFFILALIALAVIFLFFYLMYQNDIKSLEEFSASYEKFNKAISDGSESRAENALAELKTKATFKLSSLIKNEKEAMSTALEIADLSQKEFDALRDHKEYGDLTKNRKAAFARFMDLGK